MLVVVVGNRHGGLNLLGFLSASSRVFFVVVPVVFSFIFLALKMRKVESLQSYYKNVMVTKNRLTYAVSFQKLNMNLKFFFLYIFLFKGTVIDSFSFQS